MTRKTLILVLSAVILCLLASFAVGEELWDRDAKEHWHVNEAGERTDVGEHKLVEDECEVCKSAFWMYEDGMCDVSNYNEWGDMTRYSYYAADGSVLDDYKYIFQYDENGNRLSMTIYYFDTLIEVSEYGVNSNGETITKTILGYSADGSESAYLCDDYGNIVSCKITSADGRMIFEETYEYTYGENGFPVHTLQTSRFEDGTYVVVETDDMGNRLHETQYNADGTVVYNFTYEYQYDENDRLISEITLEDGKPVFENRYTYTDDEDFWGYQSTVIDYLEDGGKVVHELDEFGDTISVTTYDAQGNVVS